MLIDKYLCKVEAIPYHIENYLGPDIREVFSIAQLTPERIIQDGHSYFPDCNRHLGFLYREVRAITHGS